MNSWKAFYASCWLLECFLCKKLLRCLKRCSKKSESVGESSGEYGGWGTLSQPLLKGLGFVQLLKCWLCKLQSEVVVENWAPSADHCQLQALQFPVYLIGLLSMLLRCNSFPGDSGGCNGSDGQQTTSDHDLFFFFWFKFGFGKCFGASSWSSHWAGHLWYSYTVHFLSHITIQSRNEWFVVMQNKRRWHFKSMIFWFAVSSCVHACQVTSVVSNSAILWTVAHQAPLFMGFSRQEYWSGLPCYPPGDISDPGVESSSLMSSALAGGFFTASATWDPLNSFFTFPICFKCLWPCWVLWQLLM